MIDLQIGQKAPDFTLETNGEKTVNLVDYKGQMLVLYFYPKDNTPGCTKQAIGFTAKQALFSDKGASILGVSRDSLKKHENFISKHELTIPLGSDESGDVTENYGVWVEKKMYGKTYMGIERATFLIGADGTILEIWRKVRVKDHVQTVLDAVSIHTKI